MLLLTQLKSLAPRLRHAVAVHAASTASVAPVAPWTSLPFPLDQGRILLCTRQEVLVAHEGWSARSRALLEGFPATLAGAQAAVERTRGLQDWMLTYADADPRWKLRDSGGDGEMLLHQLVRGKQVVWVAGMQQGALTYVLLSS